MAELKERELTQQLLMPLIAKVHPGRVEYTHSGLEAGRDVVSFGTDSLGRGHILCVQAKAVAIPTGAEFAALAATLGQARTEGVTTETGVRVFPHEVWLVSSQPFPEQRRRQVADSIQKLERESIKLVAGEELCALLAEHLHDEVASLISAPDPALISIIASLDIHGEARAFGLAHEKRLSQFCVTAALTVDEDLAYRAAAGGLKARDFTSVFSVNKEILKKQNGRNGPEQAAVPSLSDVAAFAERKFAHAAFAERHGLTCRVLHDYTDRTWPAFLASGEPARFAVKLNLAEVVSKRGALVAQAIAQCPHDLAGNARQVKDVWCRVREFDEMLSYMNDRMPDCLETVSDSSLEPVRVRVTQLLDLVELERVLLVEGPAGCGKTTLLKMLCGELLKSGARATFLPCYRVPKTQKFRTFGGVALSYAIGGEAVSRGTKDLYLIVDGLDESPMDLSESIQRAAKKYKGIVMSCRSAYKARMRAQFASLRLAPFSDDERDLFFSRWFEGRPELAETALDLVRQHPDIAYHTRLPLIATIMVALVESGFAPRSRADVYGQRLDLLLSRWDAFKGVRRTSVEGPDSKRRFLQHLAYAMHDSSSRLRTISRKRLLSIYEESLGSWGYKSDVEAVVADLLLAHGVLTEETPGRFSFGHLTFQEHLAGEYLARNLPTHLIASLLDSDWWKEPLNFYASIVGDITPLITHMIEGETESYLRMVPQLKEMARYAQYTSPGAIEVLYQADTRHWPPGTELPNTRRRPRA